MLQQQGAVPNVRTYNSWSAFIKGMQPERALEILEEMKERGVEPDVITLSLIRACKQAVVVSL